MNYQEAIKEAEIQIDMYESMILYNRDFEPKNDNSNYERKIDFLKTVISAMQELQALHDQGFSLNRMKDIDFRKEIVEHINYDAYMRLMDELEEYKQLGTLEEVREAVEKQKKKKPKGDLHSVPHYRCPNCNSTVKLYQNSKKDEICKWCGQRIEWSEDDE